MKRGPVRIPSPGVASLERPDGPLAIAGSLRCRARRDSGGGVRPLAPQSAIGPPAALRHHVRLQRRRPMVRWMGPALAATALGYIATDARFIETDVNAPLSSTRIGCVLSLTVVVSLNVYLIYCMIV